MLDFFKMDLCSFLYKLEFLFLPFSNGLRNKHQYIENCKTIACRCRKLCTLFENELENLSDDSSAEEISEFFDYLVSVSVLSTAFSTTMKHMRCMILTPFFCFSNNTDIEKKLGKKFGKNGWAVLIKHITIMEKHLGLI